MKRVVRRTPEGTVWLLGLSQIIGYGTLYYAFAILSPEIARDFGWSLPSVFAVLSAALLAGGAISPFAGRCLDRYGSATVMVVGSLAATIALLLVATSPGPGLFIVGVVAMELASPFVQYNAAFALLAEHHDGAEARRRIVHLTLIAGFASTLFWPATAGLLHVLDWREIYALYAGLNLFVAAPLHLVLRRRTPGPAQLPVTTKTGFAMPSEDNPHDVPLPASLHGPALLLVTAGFALGGFLFSGITAQMVPLLASVGIGGAGVLIASLFGPAQVVVRFVNMAGAARRHPIEATLAAAALLPVAVLVLAATAPSVLGAAAFAILLGFGSGLTSIVRGTLPLALFGKAGYGERLGRISAAQLVSAAAAPVALSFLVDRFGAATALGAMAAIAGLGLVAFLRLAALRNGALRDKTPGGTPTRKPSL